MDARVKNALAQRVVSHAKVVPEPEEPELTYDKALDVDDEFAADADETRGLLTEGDEPPQ